MINIKDMWISIDNIKKISHCLDFNIVSMCEIHKLRIEYFYGDEVIVEVNDFEDYEKEALRIVEIMDARRRENGDK